MLPPSHASCLSLIFQVSVSRCCPLGESRRARKFPSGLPCSPSRIYLLLSLRKHFPHVIVTFCCNGARDGQIINRPDNTSLLFASFFFSSFLFFCVCPSGVRARSSAGRDLQSRLVIQDTNPKLAVLEQCTNKMRARGGGKRREREDKTNSENVGVRKECWEIGGKLASAI